MATSLDLLISNGLDGLQSTPEIEKQYHTFTFYRHKIQIKAAGKEANLTNYRNDES